MTLALAQAQVIDDPRTEQEHEDQRRDHGAACAHGEIAEDVEDVDPVEEFDQPIQHYASSVPIPKFASNRCTHCCELRNQRDTSKYMPDSAVLDLKFLDEFAADREELQIHHTRAR